MLMSKSIEENISIDCVKMDNENYYKITNSDLMRPFFMSMVSNGNHWMFISSNGGLTAGRKNSDFALFPYYTDDKITESAEITGNKSIFIIKNKNKSVLWEPFSIRCEGLYKTTRNLYKNTYGNKLIFEEINHDLELTYRYQWNSSNQFGFVKKTTLINNADTELEISLLDGLQNIIPYGVGADLQNAYSNLVDAYKRSELEKDTGIGIFALSALIVDKAEPSEALKATIVWSLGLENPTYLLSSLQLKKFRNKFSLEQEEDIKAEKGAYFVNSTIKLSAKQEKEWMIIANVNQDHEGISIISNKLRGNVNLKELVNKDIEAGTKKLIALNATADGIQLTADKFKDSRHFSNTLFNIMRGGVFDNNYTIEKEDFATYLLNANKEVYQASKSILKNVANEFTLTQLKEIVAKNENPNFKRLCIEYLPLKFSRRHGDPSRPWNKFSINTQSEVDGSKILDYQGNWRDIFQNWEALANSFPDFIENMIYKFLNATTFDGYNPYRVTKDGFDWEVIKENDPWSYIGYWGDHQIIYLLKFLEFLEDYKPNELAKYFTQEIFVYANVPYKIKPYQDIVKNAKDTIDFDFKLDVKLRQEKEQYGSDAFLLKDETNQIYQVNFIEKILATVLAKLSNFIPEGGIWMNTQRPEWNDANNALVGNGVSMVTLYYLRRFLVFFKEIVANSNSENFKISSELLDYYKGTRVVFENNIDLLKDQISNSDRKAILDQLGQAASDYREHIYNQSFWGKKRSISKKGLIQFLNNSLQFLEHTIDANKREDNLYHAYNLMTIENENEISIAYLDEMLEGQVAILSSGYISSKESIEILDALKNSKLFRKDQSSYMLYPNKNLPKFLEKNTLSDEAVFQSKLLQELLNDNNKQIINKDINGLFHFNGEFNNAKSLNEALNDLEISKYKDLVKLERELILQIFEDEFNHKAFTGRSGTFYGYEGLGSIYWHMVSKLQLAVQECCFRAIEEAESEEVVNKLIAHYYEINEGIGVHKSPKLYGAFPTDAYSHTPGGKGAQQPGMTGQVKEDVLCRMKELGVFIKKGKLVINPFLLHVSEFIQEPKTFNYIDVHHKKQEISLEKNSLAFTFCQVPIVFKLANKKSINIVFDNNENQKLNSLEIDLNNSFKLFKRTGEIKSLHVNLTKECCYV